MSLCAAGPWCPPGGARKRSSFSDHRSVYLPPPPSKASFALIFVSELGDKTFFIAALLAMRYGKLVAFTGSVAALATMTVISVAIGRIFHHVPASLTSSLPLGEYAAAAMLLLFGLRTVKEAWDMPSDEAKVQVEAAAAAPASDGLDEAARVVAGARAPKQDVMAAVLETFSLIFAAVSEGEGCACLPLRHPCDSSARSALCASVLSGVGRSLHVGDHRPGGHPVPVGRRRWCDGGPRGGDCHRGPGRLAPFEQDIREKGVLLLIEC